jgi:aminoglycoside phosphotransferase (APT) family kinase protein
LDEEVVMSVTSLGEPIAGTGNLYAWGEGWILKFFGDEAPAGFVEHMARLDRALYEAGLPVPAVGEMIEIEGGLGLVYEHVEGDSMAVAFLGAPEADLARVVTLGHVFATVHAEIHSHGSIGADVPSQRELFATVISGIVTLPPDLKEATLKALEGMPAGDRLCHGDFHPYNVLMSPRGPVVIDWNNSHIGNPLEDVARSVLMLSGVSLSEPSLRGPIDRFAEAYLERYFELRPGDRQQLAAWQPIVAAIRLCDNIPELEGWLLEQIRIGLDL